MTPHEIHSRLQALIAPLGKQARACIYMGVANDWPRSKEIDVTVYPNGDGAKDPCVSVKRTNWDEAFAEAEAQIPAVLTQQAQKTIRRLALAMIEIAADHGCCERQDLLDRGFSQTEIDTHGPKATAEAARLAPRAAVALSLEEA